MEKSLTNKNSIGHQRGWPIYYDHEDQEWKYQDTEELASLDNRPCTRCGKVPTKEGYDACQGFVEGKTSVCCGHGKSKPISIP